MCVCKLCVYVLQKLISHSLVYLCKHLVICPFMFSLIRFMQYICGNLKHEVSFLIIIG
ncbi:hypothetical protein Hanom_Chr14g01315571 [Helianthus anomalus]